MSEILFLSHRIPYPPDKGDKIRSYHLLRALAATHTVHLGTFIDDPADWEHAEAVRRLCGGESCIRPLNQRVARIKSLSGLLTGDPLTLAYYRDAKLSRWIRKLSSRRKLAGVFAFSSSMAQYALSASLPYGSRKVLDICDVDSDKWQQYARTHTQPMKFVYAREARKLAAVEARYLKGFDATLVISEAEARILHLIAGDSAKKCIHVVANGVDTEYFDPALPFESPFPIGARPIVFTGAMDYHANVDGVVWFASEVFPSIRKQCSNATFVVVGSNPTREVLSLRGGPGVTVTGRVTDVRPYLAHAAAVVAPLRLARGVQNKVLEALSMSKAIVATPNAVQGITAADKSGIVITADAGSMASNVLQLLNDSHDMPAGRAFVRDRFGWQQHLEHVSGLFSSSLAANDGMAGSSFAVA